MEKSLSPIVKWEGQTPTESKAKITAACGWTSIFCVCSFLPYTTQPPL